MRLLAHSTGEIAMAAAPSIQCPTCKGWIAADPHFAGQRVACPHCQGQLIMPGNASVPPGPTGSPAASQAGNPPGFANPPMPSAPGYVPPPAGGFGFRCPFCGFQGPPSTTKKISAAGWILFAALLVMCIPLCWLPFVIDGCKEEERRCLGCGSRLG
jgi:lipopolysaccharide-induced tumor necrosis factor-alpha factor